MIFVPPFAAAIDGVAGAIVKAPATAGPKPVLSCFMWSRVVPEALSHGTRPIPSFVFPESAALALARAARYGAWRRQPAGIVPDLLGIDRDEARRLVEAAEPRWLPEQQVQSLLASYGIRLAPCVLAETAADAVRAAEELGRPVTLKLESPDADAAEGAADLATAVEVTAAFRRIEAARDMARVIVQSTVKGHEALLAVTIDKNLGPIVSFALGGIFMELLRDVVFRITPITDRDAREMVRAVRSFPLLEGWRGGPAGDVEALEELMLRVSAVVEDVPELVEMDLRPLWVRPPGEGVAVLHARVNLRRIPEEAVTV